MFTLGGGGWGGGLELSVSAGHATHIQGDESVAEQAAMKSPGAVDVLWVDLVKDYSKLQIKLLFSIQGLRNCP